VTSGVESNDLQPETVGPCRCIESRLQVYSLETIDYEDKKLSYRRETARELRTVAVLG